MTSSGTQTTDRRSGPDRNEPGSPKAASSAKRPDLAVGGALVAAGWILVLYVNRWHFDAPVVFLCLGWLSVLAIGKFLWTAGVTVATEGEGPRDEGFDLAETRREELLREKRTLLKAIKEIEFDHQMGKTSAADAEEIGRFYRARAIEILRELERMDGGLDPEEREELTVREKIERELALRLQVAPPEKKAEASK